MVAETRERVQRVMVKATRWVAWMVAIAVLTAGATMASPPVPEANELPVPPGLTTQIEFWKKIFGTYSTLVPYMRHYFRIYNSRYWFQGLFPSWYYGRIGLSALRRVGVPVRAGPVSREPPEGGTPTGHSALRSFLGGAFGRLRRKQ